MDNLTLVSSPKLVLGHSPSNPRNISYTHSSFSLPLLFRKPRNFISASHSGASRRIPRHGNLPFDYFLISLSQIMLWVLFNFFIPFFSILWLFLVFEFYNSIFYDFGFLFFYLFLFFWFGIVLFIVFVFYFLVCYWNFYLIIDWYLCFRSLYIASVLVSNNGFNCL